MKLEIELTFRRKDFEEIYFNDHKADYFRSETVREPLRYLVLATLAFLALSIYAFVDHRYPLIIWGALGLLYYVFGYMKAVDSIKAWKKRVIDYLDKEEKNKRNLLVLTDDSFSLLQDSSEMIEKWANFKNAKIYDNFMTLYSADENYTFPAKSMLQEEYTALRHFVLEKMK